MVNNASFLRHLFGGVDAHGWVCAFRDDPHSENMGKWHGRPYLPNEKGDAYVDSDPDLNWYFSVAAMSHEDGWRRSKGNFKRLLACVIDDVVLDSLRGDPTYVIRTSQDKCQAGVFIDAADPDAANPALVDSLMREMAVRKMLGDRSGNGLVRYVRLPVGRNWKRSANGFATVVEQWNPGVVLSLADACAVFGINLDEIRKRPHESADMVLLEEGQDKLMAEVIEGIVTGQVYHHGLMRLASSLAATGVPGGVATNLLRGLMSAAQAEHGERWLDRYKSIPGLVDSAEKKYKQEVRRASGAVFMDVDAGDDDLIIRADKAISNVKPVDWLIEGYLECSAMSMVYGQPNVGKSFITIEQACCIGTGTMWHGKLVKQGPVLLVIGEGKEGVLRRMAAWSVDRGVSLVGAPIYITVRPIRFLDRGEAEELSKWIEEKIIMADPMNPTALRFVGIDTLARNFGDGDENSARDAGLFVSTLDETLRRRWGAHVQTVHHAAKAEGSGARGSGAFKGAMDQEYEVREGPARTIKLECKKMKDAERPPILTFGLKVIELGDKPDGDAITAAALQRLGDVMDETVALPRSGRILVKQVFDICDMQRRLAPSVREIMDKFGCAKDTASKVIRVMSERGFFTVGKTQNARIELSDLGVLTMSRAGITSTQDPQERE